jgi:hypothetical protein
MVHWILHEFCAPQNCPVPAVMMSNYLSLNVCCSLDHEFVPLGEYMEPQSVLDEYGPWSTCPMLVVCGLNFAISSPPGESRNFKLGWRVGGETLIRLQFCGWSSDNEDLDLATQWKFILVFPIWNVFVLTESSDIEAMLDLALCELMGSTSEVHLTRFHSTRFPLGFRGYTGSGVSPAHP